MQIWLTINNGEKEINPIGNEDLINQPFYFFIFFHK